MLVWNEDFLEDYLPQHARTAVNVGAHEGNWANRLATCFDRVIAIEANPISAGKLQSQKPDNMTVIPAAAWITGGHTLPFHVRGNGGMGSALACRDILRTADVEETINVAAMAIDDLDLQDVDMMLIDVEGAELQVMAGATRTIERCKPDIIIECHEREHRLWLSNWLERCGYNLCHIHEPLRELSDEWGRHVYLVGHYYRSK